MAVASREPETITLYAELAAKQVTASTWPFRVCTTLICFLLYSHIVTTCRNKKLGHFKRGRKREKNSSYEHGEGTIHD